jgi:hypothetical protein
MMSIEPISVSAASTAKAAHRLPWRLRMARISGTALVIRIAREFQREPLTQRAVRKVPRHKPGNERQRAQRFRYRLRLPGRKGRRCAAAAKQGGALAPRRLCGRRVTEG